MKKSNSALPLNAFGILTLSLAGIGIGFLTVYLTNAIQFIAASILMILGCLGLISGVFRTIADKKTKLDPFSPLVFFPLAYSIYYALGAIILGLEKSIALSTQIYLDIFLGLVFYYTGALLASIFSRSLVSSKYSIWPSTRLMQAIGVLWALAMFGSLYIISRMGLPLLLPNVKVARTDVIERVGGVVKYLAQSMEIVVILLFAYLYSSKKGRKPFRKIGWIFLFLSALFILLTVLVARRTVVAPLLTVLIMYHYLKSRISITRLAILGVTVFLLIIVAGAARSAGSFQPNQTLVSQFLYNETVRVAGAMYNLYPLFPSQYAFLGWKGALTPFLQLAPGSQDSISILLKEEVLGLTFAGGGYVPGLLGWFYINFGSYGIYIGTLFMGALLGSLYEQMLKKGDLFSTTLYSYCAIFSLNTLRSGFLNLWPVYVVLVLIVVDVFCRLKFRKTVKE